MALNNCTMSSVSIVTPGGTTNLATQTLVITPSAGFIVTSDIFSISGVTIAQNGNSPTFVDGVNGVTLPAGVASVVMSSSAAATLAAVVVNVVVDITDSYAMPSGNTTLTIDISGDATLYSNRSYDVAGTWDATVGAGVTSVTSSGTVYSSSGNHNTTATLFSKTFTSDSGKFFDTQLSVALTTGISSNYIITSTSGYLIVGGVSYHTSTTYVVKYKFPDNDVTGDNIDFTIPATAIIPLPADNITSYSMDPSVIAAVGATRTARVYGDVGATYTVTVTNEDPYYYNFTTGLFQAGSVNVAGTIGSLGYVDHSIVFPSVTDDDDYILTFAATGTTMLNMAQTNPLTINQITNRSVTWSVASASSRSFTSSPTFVKSGPVGTVNPGSRAASFIYLLTDDVDIVLRRAPLYSDFVLTNVGYNGTTNCDVVNEVVTTSPAYSAGMAGVQSLSVSNHHWVYAFGTQGATAVLALDNFINIPPVATSLLEQQVVNNTAKSIALSGTDANGDTLTFALVTSPTKGTVTINTTTGAAVYTPTDAASIGADTFRFKVNDSYQDSALMTVELSIAAP